MPPIIDTHCHYNLEPLFSGQNQDDFFPQLTEQKNWQDHWLEAQKNNVKAVINVGSSLSSSQKAIDLANCNEKMYAAIAIHPLKYTSLVKKYLKNKQNYQQVFQNIDQQLAQLNSWLEKQATAKQLAKIIAIGETGLDYFSIPDKGDKRSWIIEAQQLAFEKHLALAEQFSLPVIIHVRDKPGQTEAYTDTLKVIANKASQTTQLIFHCISGPLTYLRQALEKGSFIGVAGNITYPNADHLRELVKACPQEQLLVETDAPYLAPGKFKGQLCEPWMISQTVDFLAKELKINAEQLYENSLKVWPVLQ